LSRTVKLEIDLVSVNIEVIDLYQATRGKCIVDQDVLHVMQKHAVVMHPLPRLGEVSM
jgi:aspartate carbamoyltransferase catalytic subunit